MLYEVYFIFCKVKPPQVTQLREVKLTSIIQKLIEFYWSLISERRL